MKALFIITGCILSIYISSCARKQHVAEVIPPPIELTETGLEEPRKTMWLDSIHEQPWRWMYGKYNTSYSDGSKKISFKTSLKCSKDSALNALVSFASIPIFNALATHDSLIYVNKKDRCYGKKSIDSFKELLGVELSLSNIQELFLGQPIGYNPLQTVNDSISLTGDSCYISSRVKGQKTIEYSYVSSVKSPRLAWQKIYSPQDLTEAIIRYSNWQLNKNIYVPAVIEITIKTNVRNITVLFTYDKFELDMPQEIYLQIPNEYAPCK